MRGTGAFRAAGAMVAAAFAVILSGEARAFHSVDTTLDGRVNLSELLRAIQFYNSDGYHCLAGSEDGYAPGPGDRHCAFHDGDYNPADWSVSLSELLRSIQFYNSPGYANAADSEDGFAPGMPGPARPQEALDRFETLDTRHWTPGLSREEAVPEFPSTEEFDAVDSDGNGFITRFEFLRQSTGQFGPAPSDTGGPVFEFVGPPVLEIACGEPLNLRDVSALDPDDGDLTRYIKFVGAPNDHLQNTSRTPGEYTIVYSVEDRACNVTTASRTLIVVDAAPPVISVPNPNTLRYECGGIVGGQSFTATDDCIGNVYRSIDSSEVDVTTPGTYPVVLTATDLTGKTSTLTVEAPVSDTTRPLVDWPSRYWIVIPKGTPWEPSGATAIDTCSETLITSYTGAVDVNVPGVYPVFFTATDEAGLGTNFSRQVVVVDTEMPVFSVQFNSYPYEYFGKPAVATFSPTPVYTGLDGLLYYEANTEVTAELTCGGGFTCGDIQGLYVSVNASEYILEDCAGEVQFTVSDDIEVYAADIVDTDLCPDYGEGEGEGYCDCYCKAEIACEGEGEVEGEGEGSGSLESPFWPIAEYPEAAFPARAGEFGPHDLRRNLHEVGQLPWPQFIRIEEYLNGFDFALPSPAGDAPFTLETELAVCPWTPGNHLLRVSLQAPLYRGAARPDVNLALLVEASAQMNAPSRLPIIVPALKAMVTGTLGHNDRISIVRYAGTGSFAPLVSRLCTDEEKPEILAALDALTEPVTVSGKRGLTFAYEALGDSPSPGAINRVLMIATSDFLGGMANSITFRDQLLDGALAGKSLSTLTLGPSSGPSYLGDYVRDLGNGAVYFIDTEAEASRALHRETRCSYEQIAQSATVDVEFNPDWVAAHRMISFENNNILDYTPRPVYVMPANLRMGDHLTVLVELIPTSAVPLPPDVMGIVDLSYALPPACSRLLRQRAIISSVARVAPSTETTFAAGIAAFCMALRQSKYDGDSDLASSIALTQAGLGPDTFGLRAEFVTLMQEAAGLAALGDS